MEKIEIHLDNPSAAYFPGQNLKGNVSINTQKPQTIQSINIRVHGETSTYWKHYNTTFREHIVFSSKMVHLDDVTSLWVAGKTATTLSATNTFSFEFQLSQESPPSFVGKHGSVRYKFLVEVFRFEKKKWEMEKVFSVLPYLDLNRVSRALVPVEEKKSMCRVSKKEEAEVMVIIPQRGYTPGETVPVSVAIKNAPSSIKSLSMKLIQVVHFEAQQDTGHMFKEHLKFHHNTIENEILEVRSKPTLEENLQMELTIPEQTPPSFRTKLIQVAYKISVLPGSEKKVELELPLIIGTIQAQPQPPTYEASVKSSKGCPPAYQE